MYNNHIFSVGVHSVFLAFWKLECVTPLAIRNGLSISYEEAIARKSRGRDLKFKWKPKEGSDYEVAALHYGYEIANGQVSAYHFVPASSVRGALRSWTISHLVHPDFRSKMTPPEREDETRTQAYVDNMQAALAERRNGYQLIASLFGLALDTRGEEEQLANAGRLRLETEKFSEAKARPIAANGIVAQGKAGPDNAHRQMVVRNPLDRITHASKEGGLHHFLEFCRGESFAVRISILNPQGSDLGLINLWVREMDDGLLRIGALSSIGRGRVRVVKQSYNLWQRPGAPKIEGLEHFVASKGHDNDALADLWQSHTLPDTALGKFKKYLQEHV
ncbi:MAG: RAMP superfamily CRISPR-associated protein [Chloroflexota bacterium]